MPAIDVEDGLGLMWIDVVLVLQVAAVCDELLGSGYCRVSG